MGLDICGYKNIAQVDPAVVEKEEDGYPLDDHIRFYLNRSFPEQYNGLVEGAYYSGTYIDGPSMSYGYYNRWRDQLAKMLDYPLKSFDNGFRQQATYCAECWNGAKGPFSELINFSDCEGSIGPSTILKLSQDFATYEEQAKQHGDEFYLVYTRMKKVFDEVGNDGAIIFS